MRRALGLLAMSGGGCALLIALGRGELGTPPVDDLGGWLDQRGAVVAAFACLRLLALGLGVYVASVSALHLAAATMRSHHIAAIAGALSTPSLRNALAGTGVASAIVLGSVSPPTAQTPPRPVDTVTMHLLDAEPSTPAPPTPAPQPSSTAALAPPDVWTVAPGDSFWSIAADTMRDARGDEVDDADVVSYWATLVTENADILVAPSNPDLLFAGQVVVLPPISAA